MATRNELGGMSHVKVIGGKASALAACLVAFAAAARDITSISVDGVAGTATVEFTAGNPGDSNVLYYAWSNDGADKGSNIASWPHVVRVCRVADDATSLAFDLPPPAGVGALYASRAFLATSSSKYDHLIGSVKTGGTSGGYIDTGVCPNKTTSAVVDGQFNASSTSRTLFGVAYSSSDNNVFCFSVYINGGSKFSATIQDKVGDWKASSMSADTSRHLFHLDAATAEFKIYTNGELVETSKHTGTITKQSSTKSILLFARRNASIEQKSNSTIYSCIISNDSQCVRIYRPAVYDGKIGMYDFVNHKFYGSATSTALQSVDSSTIVYADESYAVESGDTIAAASAAFVSVSSDFTTDTPYVEENSLTVATGGSKGGAAPLVLTGANSWGGTFTVNEGALIADFGQGLASTDNLVFNGGTYGLHTGNTFNWTIGSGGGETSLGAGAATSLGFTAYGNPFSVVAGGNEATPIEFGTASSTGFNPTQFVLNDTWATDTVTLKNGITGANSDSSKPNLKIYTGAADAVIEGDISGVNFYKLGAGRLALRGANNSLGSLNLNSNGGRLVIAPPDGAATTTLSLTGGFKTEANTEVVISNAVISHGGGMDCYKTRNVTLVGCRATASGDQNWKVGYDDTWSNAGLNLDGSTITTAGYVYLGKSQATSGYVVMTNNSSLTTSYLHALRGTMDQYDGTVRIQANNGNAGWLGQGGTFTYRLWGGSLIQDNSGSSAGFAIGNSSTATGKLYVYDGATFTANGVAVYLAKGASSDNGQLYVQGGSANMTRDGAILYVGYKGNGTAEVSNGGVLDVQKGNVVAVPQSQNVAGRTGTLRVTSGGTVKARRIYSNTTDSTATIVLDGGKVVANTGSATNDLIYGFTTAVVGVGGAEIDTNGQDKEISQGFAARTGTGQTAPTATTGTELAALPAFTKTGAGTLSLTGVNDWLCATCVSNGTLSVASGALPATTLRLGGGVIDLGGASHTVANLVGSGVVSNGTLTVTGTVWPGVGDSGILKIDASASISLSSIGCAVNGDGTCGCLEVDGTLDLEGVTVVGENLESKSKGLVVVRAASITGKPVTTRVDGMAVSSDGGRLAIGLSPLIFIIR